MAILTRKSKFFIKAKVIFIICRPQAGRYLIITHNAEVVISQKFDTILSSFEEMVPLFKALTFTLYMQFTREVMWKEVLRNSATI